MKDLHVSWEEYRRLIETLAFNVYDSGWKFDSLLCLARGGLRPETSSLEFSICR